MSAGQGAGVAQRRILSSPMESVQGRTDLSLSDVPSRSDIGRGARPTGRKDKQTTSHRDGGLLDVCTQGDYERGHDSNLSAAPEN